MHAIDVRYSLLAVVGAGFFAAVPIVAVMAVRAADFDGVELPEPSLDGPAELLAPPPTPAPSTVIDARGLVDGFDDYVDHARPPCRIVPAFEGGKTIGFKLFSIAPGSLYARMGLQNGDIVTRINGHELTSPEKGLEIYAKLKDAKRVTVELKRRGAPATLTYSLE